MAAVKTVMVLCGLDAEWHDLVRPRFSLARLSRVRPAEIARLTQLTLPLNQSGGRFKVIRSLTPLYQIKLLRSAPSSSPSSTSFAPHMSPASDAFSVCCSWWARPCSSSCQIGADT